MDHTPRIQTTDTLRATLAADFRSLGGELPIRGGWGYTREDAIVIDGDDPIALAKPFLDVVGLEHVIVEKRLYEELIINQPAADKHRGIEWRRAGQRLERHGDKRFDHLTFEVSGFKVADFDWLEADWGRGLSGEAARRHHEERERRIRRYRAEYWFDITNVFGRY